MLRQTAVLGVLFVLLEFCIANAEVERPMPIVSNPTVLTDRLGGVDVPSAEVLQKMHTSQYILRAAEGKFSDSRRGASEWVLRRDSIAPTGIYAS